MLFSQGTPDLSFGIDGKVLTKITKNRDDIGQSVTVQSNGKTIVIGNSFNTIGYSDIGIVRYKANGRLDKTFNGTGKQLIKNAFCNVVKVQQDGKIAIGGSVAIGSTTAFGLWRLNSDGTLDNTFGVNGYQEVKFGGYVICFAMTLQNDGKILIGGNDGNFYAGNSSLIIARLNTDGTLDNTFSGDGKFSFNLTKKSLTCKEILLQPDGKIIAAGVLDTVRDPVFINEFYAMRINSDGTVDGTFGNGGYTRAKATTSDVAYSAALLPDGRTVMSGFSDFGSYNRASVLALNADGTVDNAFGTNGWVYPDFYGGSGIFTATMAQTNGKIILAGVIYNTNATSSIGLARLNDDGTFDLTFAHAGRDTFFNGGIYCNDATMQNDGKIVVTGWQLKGNDYLMTARFLNGTQFQKMEPVVTNAKIGELNLFPIPVSGTSARLIFTVREPVEAIIRIYDLNGREITAPLRVQCSGRMLDQTLSLPENLHNGIYVCTVEADGVLRTVKFEIHNF